MHQMFFLCACRTTRLQAVLVLAGRMLASCSLRGLWLQCHPDRGVHMQDANDRGWLRPSSALREQEGAPPDMVATLTTAVEISKVGHQPAAAARLRALPLHDTAWSPTCVPVQVHAAVPFRRAS